MVEQKRAQSLVAQAAQAWRAHQRAVHHHCAREQQGVALVAQRHFADPTATRLSPQQGRLIVANLIPSGFPQDLNLRFGAMLARQGSG